MAPKTRSMALQNVATIPKVRDSHRNIKLGTPKGSNSNGYQGSGTQPNPWCMSEEQIQRVCDHFANVGKAKSPWEYVRNHCVQQPALLPVEMDYLVNLLASVAKAQGGRERYKGYSHLDWDDVADKFNARFSADDMARRCEPRKVTVLKCAMRGNYQKVRIALLRERCREAHEGADNAGIYGSLTAEQLEHCLIHGRP
ncbi:hypothetical protein HO133_006551 [Letharia lupina]|uniref:Uncharacterized protein n=1 Tax=Letharia lupina TaxID=560253 RepID=A0A8H6C6H6_9LECA|nr:uncharacterized protein HO133_006551 [Letharia lupina]KAF6217724.1 hypothetical protein HO133_006551 [Letharia lupina]